MQVTRISRASWFKVKTGDKILHFDPGYTGYFRNQGIPLDEIADKANLILISHFHKDHLQPEALARIADADTLIVAPESCIQRITYRVKCIKPGEVLIAGKIKIEAVDAYNTDKGHSTRKVHHKGAFVGYLVYLESQVMYFAGDTDYIPEMKHLGKVDIAFLPIGGTFVMDAGEAVQAVLSINPRMVIPMHQSNSNPDVFKELLSKSDTEVIVLGVGEKVTI